MAKTATKTTSKGKLQPRTKPGHNGAYPEDTKPGSYKPTDPKHARTVRV